MKLLLLKCEMRSLSVLMALVMSISVLGCGGADSGADSETPSADPGSETVTEAPEAEMPAAKAPVKEEAPPAPKTETPAPKTKTPAPKVKNPSTPKTPAPKTSKKAETTSTDLKPEVAVKAWFVGLAKGPTSAWSAFPASYQKDMNELVQLFSKNMDAELWSRGFGTLKKVTALLKSKKEILLDPSYLTTAKMDAKEAGIAFDHITGLLDTFAASDLSDLSKLNNFDGNKFFTTTGSQCFSHIEALADLGFAKAGKKSQWSDIANTKVTLIKNEGNTATLKIEVPDKEPKEREFVKVEGKWIPQDLNTADWKKKMDEARSKLTQISPVIQVKKEAVLKSIDMVDGVIAKLEKTETKEQLQAEVLSVVGPLIPIIMQMQQGMMKPAGTAPQARPTPVPPVEKKAVEKKATLKKKTPATPEKKE